MSARIAHQVTDDGVLVVLRPLIGSPSSLRVSEAEAKRFAFAILADVDPTGGHGEDGGTLSCGPIAIDLATSDVTVGGKRIHFTGAEYKLLCLLARRPGYNFSKEAIFAHLYEGRDDVEIKILDVFICRIRNKLRPFKAEGHIETVWGRGYRIVHEPTIEAYMQASSGRSPPRPIQDAVFARLKQGPASFPELWTAVPMAGESSIRAALAALVNRGDALRSGEPKRALYSLPLARGGR